MYIYISLTLYIVHYTKLHCHKYKNYNLFCLCFLLLLG